MMITKERTFSFKRKISHQHTNAKETNISSLDLPLESAQRQQSAILLHSILYCPPKALCNTCLSNWPHCISNIWLLFTCLKVIESNLSSSQTIFHSQQKGFDKLQDQNMASLWNPSTSGSQWKYYTEKWQALLK